MCWERAGHYPLQRGVGRQQRETLGVAYLFYALARSNVAESSTPAGVDSAYGPAAPNGSRLSCGRNARRRKVVERMGRSGGEAMQFFPTCERPTPSSACYAAPPESLTQKRGSPR